MSCLVPLLWTEAHKKIETRLKSNKWKPFTSVTYPFIWSFTIPWCCNGFSKSSVLTVILNYTKLSVISSHCIEGKLDKIVLVKYNLVIVLLNISWIVFIVEINNDNQFKTLNDATLVRLFYCKHSRVNLLFQAPQRVIVE